MTAAHVWDLTGVVAVNKVVFRYRRKGADVEVLGMNEASRSLVAQTGAHDKTHLPGGAGAH